MENSDNVEDIKQALLLVDIIGVNDKGGYECTNTNTRNIEQRKPR